MIQRQFHHLVRIVPGNGLIVHPSDDKALQEVLGMGCWTPLETFGPDGLWQAEPVEADGSHFRVLLNGEAVGEVRWDLTGDHNLRNGLAAIAAARHAGVPVSHCIDGLSAFRNVKRRMELRGEINGIRLYDDFAHHPTAIETTLAGLRRQVGEQRIIAVLEPRSNTMRMGIHKDSLPASLASADRVMVFSPPSLDWDAEAVFASLGEKATVFDTTEAIVDTLKREALPGDQLLVMSNGGFEGIHQRILEALRT
jgi:UDP-N-acetylmuramate: L-alanyl-gamma-D-glutamyl-meso-diaminopimelate ligase